METEKKSLTSFSGKVFFLKLVWLKFLEKLRNLVNFVIFEKNTSTFFGQELD